MQIIVKTLQGLEEALAAEMRSLGIRKVTLFKRAVGGEGTLRDVYRLNLSLQTGIRVLVPLSDFPLRVADNLYYAGLDVPWEDYFSPNDTFAVYANGHHHKINHSGFAALKLKDGIVDRFRRKFKRRPDVDTDNPDIRIELQFNNRSARIMIDSTGDSLHKRGYKEEQGEAPVSEVLAAGLLYMMGWRDRIALLDPMCGSGTFSTEAALKATNSLAQFHRGEFTCRNWKSYKKRDWQKERDHGMKVRKKAPSKIYCSDKVAENVAMARVNARKAGVVEWIDFNVVDFFHISPPKTRGHIILNPPYGERISQHDIKGFYREIAHKLKKDFKGWRAGILSGSDEGLKSLGMRAAHSYDVLNGDIPCQFQVIDIR